MFISFLVFLITTSIERSNGTHFPFYFGRASVRDITFGRNADFHFMRNDIIEIRSKLCYYAKMKENLVYISYELGTVEPPPVRHLKLWPTPAITGHLEYPKQLPRSLYISSSDIGMACPTVPKIYLIQQRPYRFCLQITYIESSIGTTEKFDIQVTKVTSSVIKFSSKNDEESKYAKLSPTYDLDERDWQNLCSIAREHISPLYFLNHQILKADVYEFRGTTGETRVNVASSCPTLPRVFVIVHRGEGDLRKKVEFVVVPSFIDSYEFENDENMPSSALPLFTEIPPELRMHNFAHLDFMNRRNLCSVVRRYYTSPLVPFVVDRSVFVQKARMYLFKYPSREEKISLAMVCPELPAVYLRLDNSTAPKITIKIMSLQSSTDDYNYSIEILPQVILYTEEFEEEVNKSVVFPLLDKLETHFFSSLTTQDRWNLCSSAQKYILNDDGLKFHFTKNERIFADYKLLLIPANVSHPGVYMLHPTEKADIFIRCSQWPQMYVRLGQSDSDIKITLLQYELVPYRTNNKL